MATSTASLRRAFAALLLVVAAAGAPECLLAQSAQKKVLVVYSRARETAFSRAGDRLLPGLLERGLGAKVDYYSEYLELPRFPGPEYGAAFRDYLRLKYRNARFDAIIATHGLAYAFVASHRDELFPGTPIVFLSEERVTQRAARSAGIIVARDFRSTLDVALALQPGTKEVFVVIGNSGRDAEVGMEARAQFESFTPALDFTYSSGLTTEQLEQRIAGLPAYAIAYYVLFYQDAGGVNVNPTEYVDRLAAIANRPVYSWNESTLNRGVIGGHLLSVEKQVRAVGDLAVRVLRGEPPDAIPMQEAGLAASQVDWRQLQRWGISEARVPRGTAVLFRPPSAWDRYKGYILGATAVVLAQGGLISLLLLQRTRLRRAGERLRAREADLRVSYQRIRDLGGRLLTAQDAERSRIALELHDDIGQQVAVLSMNLQMLSSRGPRPDGGATLAREAIEQVEGILRSLRDLSHRLYPAKLRLLGLVPALATLQRDFSTRDVSVAFSHDDVPTGLPHELTLSLFRIAQEALRNAVHHGGAHELFLHLEGSGDDLVLTVTDDGTGFDASAATGKGLGLISMQERLEPFGGTLTIESAPGSSTRLEVTIPNVSSLRPTTVAV